MKDIFHLLEADFNPLELCTKLAPLLEKLPALNAEVRSNDILQSCCSSNDNPYSSSMLHDICTLAFCSLACITWVETTRVAAVKIDATLQHQCCAGCMNAEHTSRFVPAAVFVRAGPDGGPGAVPPGAAARRHHQDAAAAVPGAALLPPVVLALLSC